jgi:hypothetical protein
VKAGIKTKFFSAFFTLPREAYYVLGVLGLTAIIATALVNGLTTNQIGAEVTTHGVNVGSPHGKSVKPGQEIITGGDDAQAATPKDSNGRESNPKMTATPNDKYSNESADTGRDQSKERTKTAELIEQARGKANTKPLPDVYYSRDRLEGDTPNPDAFERSAHLCGPRSKEQPWPCYLPRWKRALPENTIQGVE